MATADEPLTAWGYSLSVLNGTLGFRLNLRVMVDATPYTLDVTDPKVPPELVQKVLRAIAKKWPNEQWQFHADANGKITDVVIETAK